MRICLDVCDAVEHIASLGIIHRDISTRNILACRMVSRDPSRVDQVIVKLSDFGLAETAELVRTLSRHCLLKGVTSLILIKSSLGMFQMSSSPPADLPIRWMSPEAISRNVWSEKSDVWAFGVMMWEIWSDAQIPLSEFTNDEVCPLSPRANK